MSQVIEQNNEVATLFTAHLNQLVQLILSQGVQESNNRETTLYLDSHPSEQEEVIGGELEWSNPYKLIFDHEEQSVSIYSPKAIEALYRLESGNHYPNGLSIEQMQSLTLLMAEYTATQSVEVMSISAEREMRSAQTEAKQQEFTKPKAELKIFSGGAMVFGEAAEECADILECPEALKLTSRGDASLKLDEAQLEIVQEALTNRGYEVVIVEPKIPANISLHGQSATVYGKAAELVSQHFNLPVGTTDKGTTKVRINREQVESVTSLLTDQGFKVQSQEIESTLKPKVVFREAPDGETYTVFDGSAKNLAKALEREPDNTPGGRPMLTFDRAEYKDLKTRFKEDLDISTKDLELKAQISTYEVSGRRGAVIVGSAALEAAAALGKEIEWTKPSAKTGKPLPKLKLEESEIPSVKECLESQGYDVSVEAMQQGEFGKQALMKTYAKGAMLFGEPAELIAKTLDLKIESASNGNAMLKLEEEQLETAKQTLEEAGYTVKVEALQSQSGNTAFINTASNGEAIVFGEVAQQISEALNIEVQTSKQSQKSYLKLTAEQIEPAQSALEAQGLKVEVKPLDTQPQQKSKPIQRSQGTER